MDEHQLDNFKAWSDFYKVLDKGERVYSQDIIPQSLEDIGMGGTIVDHKLNIYSFGDVLIGKEEYNHREAVMGVHGPPRFPGMDTKEAWVHFYVYEGGSLLSEEDDIKGAILEATGVKLPSLTSYDRTVKVITEIDLDEDLDFNARLEAQPSEDMLAIMAHNMRQQLETSPEEFNLGNLGYDMSHNEDIIKIIYELAGKWP